MSEFESIVILTRSSKNHGYCVAGINVITGKMVRLVTNNQAIHGALNYTDLRDTNGNNISPLDLVEVSVIRPEPLKTQPENILIDQSTPMRQIRRFSLKEVIKIRPLDNYKYIFGNNNPYLTETEMFFNKNSLVMVEVNNLELYNVQSNGNTKTKANFNYNDVHYENISVTDPIFYNAALHGMHDKATLVISLPDAAWHGCYYKFISKIFMNNL